MTLQEQIESELKSINLELSDVQGKLSGTVKEKNFLIRNQIILRYVKLKYSHQEIADALDLHFSAVAKVVKNYSKEMTVCSEDNINRMKRYLKIEHYRG